MLEDNNTLPLCPGRLRLMSRIGLVIISSRRPVAEPFLDRAQLSDSTRIITTFRPHILFRNFSSFVSAEVPQFFQIYWKWGADVTPAEDWETRENCTCIIATSNVPGNLKMVVVIKLVVLIDGSRKSWCQEDITRFWCDCLSSGGFTQVFEGLIDFKTARLDKIPRKSGRTSSIGILMLQPLLWSSSYDSYK